MSGDWVDVWLFALGFMALLYLGEYAYKVLDWLLTKLEERHK